MRIVGELRLPSAGMRGPTPQEVEASVENARRMPRVIPMGVYRYRSHAEANADMDRWTADAMVARAKELARR